MTPPKVCFLLSCRSSGEELKLAIEFADKKVVLFSVPGAFTGTCSERHLPGYIKNMPRFREKGVDVIACIAYNDAYVMSAWGKVNQVKDDDIVSLPTMSLTLDRECS